MRRLVTIGVICCLVLSAGRLAAQDKPKPKERPATAEEAYALGGKLFKKKDYKAAITAFERAYQLRPHFYVRCSIARCYENLGDLVKATRYYQRCLDEGARASPMAKSVQGSLEAVQARLSWVTVKSAGKGGTIYVDGKPAGDVPGRVPLSPGSHVIEVRRAGARPAKLTITAIGGEQRTVQLEPVDGQPERPKVLAATQPTQPAPRPASRRRLRSYWFWGAVGITAALSVVYTALAVRTTVLHSDYNNEPTEEGYDAFAGHRTATNVVFGFALAAAASSTALFFFTDFGGRKEQPSAEQQARRFVLGVRGSF